MQGEAACGLKSSIGSGLGSSGGVGSGAGCRFGCRLSVKGLQAAASHSQGHKVLWGDGQHRTASRAIGCSMQGAGCRVRAAASRFQGWALRCWLCDWVQSVRSQEHLRCSITFSAGTSTRRSRSTSLGTCVCVVGRACWCARRVSLLSECVMRARVLNVSYVACVCI